MGTLHDRRRRRGPPRSRRPSATATDAELVAALEADPFHAGLAAHGDARDATVSLSDDALLEAELRAIQLDRRVVSVVRVR